MKTILIVEDDPAIGALLKDALGREGYGVRQAYSGTEAVLALREARPDLVLLDLMLPGLSGEEVLGRLTGIPVIVVSARAQVEDKVALLKLGAADYVTKPFDLRELTARIEARLRPDGPAPALLRHGALELDLETRIARSGAAETRLTRTEYAILKLLMLNPGRVLTRSRLLDEIAADTPDCTEDSLKVHMSNLRRKLRDLGLEDPISAVWGVGFILTEP